MVCKKPRLDFALTKCHFFIKGYRILEGVENLKMLVL